MEVEIERLDRIEDIKLEVEENVGGAGSLKPPRLKLGWRGAANGRGTRV